MIVMYFLDHKYQNCVQLRLFSHPSFLPFNFTFEKWSLVNGRNMEPLLTGKLSCVDCWLHCCITQFCT